jgi:peptidoglycan/LPS O-acetylase OafA/YrhL
MSRLPSEKLSYRPDIEGLRGVAVLLVVAFHSSPRRFQGGFLGVDVFFVLSGYLITGLVVREIEETGRLSLAGFYARRARRLLPASAFVLLVTILACSLFLSPLQQYRLGSSGLSTALYVSNFWFLHKSADYFAPAIEHNPFLHTWSLAVEEQFYLVWPTLVLLCMRGRRPRRNLLAIMILIGSVSLGASVWITKTHQPWSFFSPASRAWEFAIGAITLLLVPLQARVSCRLRALASWLGLAAILAAAALVHGQSGWPGWRAIIPVLGTAAILDGRVTRLGAAKILELPILQWIGRLSYSWYLWHWPVITLARTVNSGFTFAQKLYETIVCVVGSLALAAVTHALIENPVRFSRYLASRRALSLVGVGMVTVLTAGTAVIWQHSASETALALGHGSISEALKRPEVSDNSCPDVGFLDTEVVECVSGNSTSSSTVVLFGDSHAGQWVPTFTAIASDRGWRVVLIIKPACPSARVSVFNSFLNRPYTECNTWREAAMKRIIEIHPATVVVTNRQLQNVLSGLSGTNEAWREGTRETLETLDSAGLNTILIRDTPSPGFDVPDCLTGDSSWWARIHASGKNPCMADRTKALNDGVFLAEQEAASGLRHVHILDLSDLFCDGPVCPPTKNGLIIYSDDNHMSAQFARSLAPAVATVISRFD